MFAAAGTVPVAALAPAARWPTRQPGSSEEEARKLVLHNNAKPAAILRKRNRRNLETMSSHVSQGMCRKHCRKLVCPLMAAMLVRPKTAEPEKVRQE